MDAEGRAEESRDVMGGRRLVCIGLFLSLGCSSDRPGPSDAGPPDAATVLWKNVPGGQNGVVLSALDAGAWFLAPDGTSLVWASASGIFETDRSTGATRQLVFRESIFDGPIAVVVDEAGIYWTASDDVVRRRDPSSGAVTVLAATANDTAALAVSGGLLFIGDATGVTIRPTDGGAPLLSFDVGGKVFTLAVDGSDGFASVLPSGGGFDFDIVRFDLSGDAGLIAQAQPSAQVIIGMDESHVYWGTGERYGDGGALVRAPRAGGATETLTSLDLPVAAGTVDGPRVYFSTFPGALQGAPVPPQALYRYETTTSSTTLLATDLFYVLEVVTTPEGLYFTEEGRRLDRIVPRP